MKPILLAFVFLAALAACKNEESGKADQYIQISENAAPKPVDSSRFTTVKWLDSLQDFGSVTDGEKVNVTFRFKNTGEFPLIVESAVAGCGCTIPEYTTDPVLPGKEGFIKAVFNSTGQPPTVHKSVNVVMNTKGTQTHTVTFIGEVKK